MFLVNTVKFSAINLYYVLPNIIDYGKSRRYNFKIYKINKKSIKKWLVFLFLGTKLFKSNKSGNKDFKRLKGHSL